MSRSTSDRLQDIIESSDLAMRHGAGLDARALARTPGPRDAALFRLAVVCEAASRLAPEMQALAPEIPWVKIKGMRNYIVHAYWQIDLVVAVDTISTDLEPLKAAVANLIVLIERNEA